MDEARAKAFRSLKPPCVELSQLALKSKAKNATGKQIIKSIENLHLVLQDVSKQDNVLNGKLADYVFFPLSHVFRDNKELPVRAVEVALQCLLLLICGGWRTHISPELGKQLLILLAFLAGGSPIEANSKDVNEELGNAAFQCLAALFKFTGNAGLGGKGSVKSENYPVLGHAITVILEGINNGPALEVQIAALDALASIINGISDESALRSFFPGIVSSLAKVLRPNGSSATSFRILVSSLQILETVLLKVISDQASFKAEGDAREPNLIKGSHKEKIDQWVQASSSQIKMALANVIPLRYHERYEVQVSLFQLCVSIIQRCRKSLSQSIAMIVETLITLCGQKHFIVAPESLKTARDLFIADPELLEMLKSSLHDWVIALPRIMQSSDDEPKKKSVDRISVAFQMISSQDATSDVLTDALALNLRTSISVAVQASSSQIVHPISGGSLEVTKMLQSPGLGETFSSFSPVLFNETSQKSILNGLETLVRQLKPLPMSNNLQQGIANAIRTTSGDEQLASLWLSLQFLKNEAQEKYDIHQYLHLPIDSVEEPLLDDIYSFSLEILSNPTFEDKISWRMQALSLEVIALQANHQKEDFRPEFVDALYPILERMGSPNAALQHHAITCLTLVSHACKYPSPSALIVANADYLVNAVALKLNTFEISPQAPLVLVMMIKLCGPALIPYLDDLVESIFAILACFHGYPRLVESLFSVLHAIVEESGKTPIPAILPPSAPTTRQPVYKPIDMASIASRLRELKNPPSPPSPPSSPPLTPTKDLPPPPAQSEEEGPPLPPHTKLLLSIALQTQNHLNSPSQPLLLSLLSLLTTAFPPLTPYPNHLLPLLASTFSLLLPPLHSQSPQLCIAACAALSAACTAGGDFLSSRIDDEWDSLINLCARRKRDLRRTTEKQQKTPLNRGGGFQSINHRAWTALTDLLVTIVRTVGVRAEREDDVFDVLVGEVGREDVRGCLGELNADALWLAEAREKGGGGEEGGRGVLVPPLVEGWTLPVVEF